MKLLNSSQKGGALLVALLSSVVVCLTLGSYLQYTGTQSRSIMRSQIWNSAIPIAEAGIEEGLAHINESTIGTNFAINGWTVVNGQFEKNGSIPDGGRYVARISTDSYPIITCTGYATNSRAGAELERTVQINTTRWGTGMKGIITKGNITMVGITSIDSFDSEDEAYSTLGRYDPAKHKDGGYAASVFGNVYGQTVYGAVGTGPNGTASGNVGTFAWLASNTGIQPGHYANDVNMAFPDVQPPFAGGASSLGGPQSVTITNYTYWTSIVTTASLPLTPPASPITTNLVGTNVVTTYPVGISPSLVTTNFLIDQRSKTMPASGTYMNLSLKGSWYYYDQITSYAYPAVTYTYSMTVTNNSTTSTTYNWVLSGDRYQTSNLRMSGGEKGLITGTNVILYVTHDFQMTGNSELIIAPGASLQLYVAGDVSLAGNGVFNHTMDASKFMLFGLPSNRNISISGNAAFTGVIYAPQADISMNGGGATIYDVVGAIVANTANLNGHFQFHYDERLGRSKILSKYSVASWREL